MTCWDTPQIYLIVNTSRAVIPFLYSPELLLVKSESACYSFDDLKKDRRTPWKASAISVQELYARQHEVGDLVFFYHSMGTVAEPTGIYGIAKVATLAHADESAYDPKDEHYGCQAVKYRKEGKDPMWSCVDLEFVSKFAQPVTLEA